jgi:tol-pal system protein YbgF
MRLLRARPSCAAKQGTKATFFFRTRGSFSYDAGSGVCVSLQRGGEHVSPASYSSPALGRAPGYSPRVRGRAPSCGSRAHTSTNVGAIGALAALWLPPLLVACGHAQPQEPTTPPQAQQAALAEELDLLRHELDERSLLVTQLESRLSLLEAEQRQLRQALAEREASTIGLRETVRIGERGEREPRTSIRREEPRPVLRLGAGNDRRSVEEPVVPLQPVPQVSERLPVAPVPALGSAGAYPPPPQSDPYLEAMDLVRRRDFAAALEKLEVFLAERPGDARATRALFWRGEVLFAQKRYELALSAFEGALSREPRGEKAADALLKIGLCHRRLGQPDKARAALEQLKAQFPDSYAARLAQAEEA